MSIKVNIDRLLQYKANDAAGHNDLQYGMGVKIQDWDTDEHCGVVGIGSAGAYAGIVFRPIKKGKIGGIITCPGEYCQVQIKASTAVAKHALLKVNDAGTFEPTTGDDALCMALEAISSSTSIQLCDVVTLNARAVNRADAT